MARDPAQQAAPKSQGKWRRHFSTISYLDQRLARLDTVDGHLRERLAANEVARQEFKARRDQLIAEGAAEQATGLA